MTFCLWSNQLTWFHLIQLLSQNNWNPLFPSSLKEENHNQQLSCIQTINNKSKLRSKKVLAKERHLLLPTSAPIFISSTFHSFHSFSWTSVIQHPPPLPLMANHTHSGISWKCANDILLRKTCWWNVSLINRTPYNMWVTIIQQQSNKKQENLSSMKGKRTDNEPSSYLNQHI